MKREIAQAWTAALRSGDYPQAVGTLCRQVGDSGLGYCCLGVVTQIGIDLGVLDPETMHSETGLLAPSAMRWMELRQHSKNPQVLVTRDPDTGEEMRRSLAALNDDRIPFDVIADYIDAQWEDL